MPSALPTNPATPVLVDFRKWDGAQHWQEPTTYLGTDEYGRWLGMRAGTTFERPGHRVVSRSDSVKVATEKGWFATFNGPGHHIQTYVDITTIGQSRPLDDGFAFTLIDLDLDVVREHGGRLYVDDEDEFEEHQRLYGYPQDVIARALRDCSGVRNAVSARDEPFAQRPQHWLDRLISPQESLLS